MNEVAAQAPVLGQLWPEQGGVYVGQRLVDGQVHHVIALPGVESDIADVQFDAAVKAASDLGEVNGHSDWHAPGQEDLMLAYINARDQFHQKGLKSIYWTRTPYDAHRAWAVDFERGDVDTSYRSNEFRVRPFRSFIA